MTGMMNPMDPKGHALLAQLGKNHSKLLISNLPLEFSEKEIREVLSVLGNVKTVEKIIEQSSGTYKGQAYVEYATEEETRKAMNLIMGMKIGDNVLLVKRLSSSTPASLYLPSDKGDEGEGVFKALIEDRPTCCIVLKNIVIVEEITDRNEYNELENDTYEEMCEYGKVVRVHIPKPPLLGDGKAMPPGVGKVYVKFEQTEEAARAKKAMLGRRYEGRVVETMFYPEEKFNRGQFD